MMDKYIQQFVAELKKEGKNPATLSQYQKHLKLFGALTKIENLSKINSLTIRKFRIFLVDEKNKLLPSTQNYYLISLRAFLKFLKKIKFIEDKYSEDSPGFCGKAGKSVLAGGRNPAIIVKEALLI